MTELIQWRDDFRTGIPSIDHEHEGMIKLINSIAADLDSNTPDEQIRAALGKIHMMIEAHFALEEMLMQKHGYGEYLEHKTHHEALLDEILDIMDHVEKYRDANFYENLKGRLDGWFGVHFSTLDRKLHGLVDHA